MHEQRVRSLEKVTLDEALAYLDRAEGDELLAAEDLAQDRNLLDSCAELPDPADVHHALFLLRRARGLPPPSPDLMRSQQLRRKAA